MTRKVLHKLPFESLVMSCRAFECRARHALFARAPYTPSAPAERNDPIRADDLSLCQVVEGRDAHRPAQLPPAALTLRGTL